VAEAVEARVGAFFFKVEEATRDLAVDPFTLEDAAGDH
jgi:hypothetical protein